MTKILSIALVSLRAAVRSRLVGSLVAVLLVAIVGLGLSVKGDGTLSGQMRILLCYTLGLSTLLLGIATLWTACGGISEEIKDKHIQLLVVKPVHRSQIWLGKWLALVLLNAALLALAGIAVYAVLQVKVRAAGAAPADRLALYEEILTARRSLSPRAEPVDDEVRKRLALMEQQHAISDRTSRREVYVSLEKRVRAERSTVPPGGAKQWIFDIPRGFAQGPNAACSLRVRLYPVSRSMTPLKGRWTVGRPGDPPSFSHSMEARLESAYCFTVPPSAFRSGQPAVVQFENDEGRESRTLVLDPEQNVELLSKESSFEMNLVRALLILLGHLSLLAALGLAASTVFSFPVATFVAAAIMIVSLFGHYMAATAGTPKHEHEHDESAQPSLLTVVSERIMERLVVVIEPVVRTDPLDPLSDGVLVSWSFTGQAAVILFVAYPAVLFLVGAYCLKRRELALPD